MGRNTTPGILFPEKLYRNNLKQYLTVTVTPHFCPVKYMPRKMCPQLEVAFYTYALSRDYTSFNTSLTFIPERTPSCSTMIMEEGNNSFDLPKPSVFLFYIDVDSKQESV